MGVATICKHFFLSPLALEKLFS